MNGMWAAGWLCSAARFPVMAISYPEGMALAEVMSGTAIQEQYELKV